MTMMPPNNWSPTERWAMGSDFCTAPTDYSRLKTTQQYAPWLPRRLRQDEVDARILTAL